MSQHPTTVLYHADCIDGFGAAYAAWKKFGDKATYRPVQYGEQVRPQELAGRQVYILDFALSREQSKAIAVVAQGVVQLDHHATARVAWQEELGTGEGGNCFRHPQLPLTITFDLDKSGARLAWEYFHPGGVVPWPIRHIEDQDLWRFTLPGTRSFNRALRQLPFDFHVWDLMMKQAGTPGSKRYQSMLAEGEAIESFCQREVERLACSALVTSVQLRGAPVAVEAAKRQGVPYIAADARAWRAVSGLAINASALFASELGDRLVDKCGTFALIWYAMADGNAKVSLRAKGKVNVATLAERYGGGGHRNAAGFRMPLARFVAEILGKNIGSN